MVAVGSRRSINCFEWPLIAIEENFLVSQMDIIPNPAPAATCSYAAPKRRRLLIPMGHQATLR